MKSLAYILFTVVITLLIVVGWQGGGYGHGYMHLGFLILGGFLSGVVYKEVLNDVREESKAEQSHTTRYI
jgi:hypothetical protein